MEGIEQSRAAVLDSQVHAIVAELCAAQIFPLFERVMTVVLQRYGVQEFAQLCCGPITQIPSLVLLMEIQKKVIQVEVLIITSTNSL
jgi:hypothetical protein